MNAGLRAAVALAMLPLLCAGTGASRPAYRAAGTIVATGFPYLPGSVVPIRIDGFQGPYQLTALGPGSIAGDALAIPDDARAGTTAVIAGNAHGLAKRTFAIVAPPSPRRAFLAIASYDDGIVFHDARSFAPLGVLAGHGSPGDVAVAADAATAAPDTQGDSVQVSSFDPWSVRRIGGVPLGDEIAIDPTTGATFVTNRDGAGGGALTRIARNGSVTVTPTGQTAEGLAIDSRRGIAYVANANDGTIAAIDLHSMRLVRRWKAIDRVFSLVLSGDGSRLYAISNQSRSSPFGAAGAAIAFDPRTTVPRVVARSAELTFPLGAALDRSGRTLFVTDEAADRVYVLDARTLRARHAPLSTCRTPWKPAIAADRLFVPCARADAVDVFDARTLRRVPGAPFATGGYPLAVAVWLPPMPGNTQP